ncbi:MAG: hypothetical protein HYX84_07910 [Chloroflexi bacterium]|nr:hypothetical protein [Chloroflexota bacterium]
MAKFLTTAAAINEIDRIITNTKEREHLVLICPFIKIQDNLFQNLQDVDRRGVKTTLVYGKSDLKPEEEKRLKQLENLSLLFLENVHAKCFFNDETMVITSYNMYNASGQNREMGVLLTKRDDLECYSDARKEAGLIVRLAEKHKFTGTSVKSTHGMTHESGFCIRCQKGIPLDTEEPFKPFCYECYQQWTEEPDWYYERFRHLCGKPTDTTRDKPFCRSCYRKIRKD